MRFIFAFTVMVTIAASAYALPDRVKIFDKMDSASFYSYSFITQNWEPDQRGKWFRDNNRLDSIWYFTDSIPDSPSTKLIMSYDEQGNLTGFRTITLNNNNIFISTANDKYTYDSRNRITSNESWEYDSVQITRMEYSYGDQDSVQSGYYLIMNEAAQRLDTVYTFTKEYNQQNLLSGQTIQIYNNNQAVPGYKTVYEYSYNQMDSLTEQKYSTYIHDSVQTQGYLNRNFNTNGQLVEEISSNFKIAQRDTVSIVHYEYDDKNRITSIRDSSIIDPITSYRNYSYPDNYTAILTDGYVDYSLIDPTDYPQNKTVIYYPQSLSVNDQAETTSSLLISPNPIKPNNLIKISIGSNLTGNVEINLFDQSGRVISLFKTSPINGNITFPCPEAPAGAYFIRVISGGKVVGMCKLMIE